MEFWSMVGEKVQQSGEATEKLIKNLSCKYQRVRQHLLLSGISTETPLLRGSNEVFRAFEQYLSMFYPQGCTALPKLIVTEKSIVK